MRITFIGGGNMGEAMLAAILSRGLAEPQQVTVSDISPERRKYMTGRYHVATTEENQTAVAGSDVVVLAIKPQSLTEVVTALSGHFEPTQLVLSIIAGVSLDTICRGLEHQAAVRAMPNTPAQIGRGMTVWTATTQVTGQQREWARAILGAMGQEIAVDAEDDIDRATAISGSGPAYLFYFVEALMAAGGHIGLREDIARRLVLATILGASHLLDESGREAAELRRMVTSPGGTTAAALDILEAGDLLGLVRQAVSAAYERAKELGEG